MARDAPELTLDEIRMIAEIIHGTPVWFSDRARYSFELGGKDGHPFLSR